MDYIIINIYFPCVSLTPLSIKNGDKGLVN